MASNTLESAFSYCEDIVRKQDPDRYWASLFVPADKRQYLYALYAFNAEIARIRNVVSAPLLGEIRAQWWKDQLNAPENSKRDHPVVEALIAAIFRFSLPLQTFQNLIDARIFDLYDDPMPSLNDLEGYCGETSSVLFRLSSLILADGPEPNTADAAGHAGVAYGMIGLLRDLSQHTNRGQTFLPKDILEKYGLASEDLRSSSLNKENFQCVLAELNALIREHFRKGVMLLPEVDPKVKAAFLPLSLVPLYLSSIERKRYNLLTSIIDIPQWKRLWTLWKAAQSW